MGNAIDEKTSDEMVAIDTAVRSVMSKPHAKFIVYLLTRRYSPRNVRETLGKMALSSPGEDMMRRFYLSEIDPVVKELGLGRVYSTYKARLLTPSSKPGKRKSGSPLDFSGNTLKFKLEIAGDVDLELKFIEFINRLDILDSWRNEFHNYYGTRENVPKRPNGECPIDSFSRRRGVERILQSSIRYVIDQMILQNVSASRIADYMRANHHMNIDHGDVVYYQKIFFNLQTYEIPKRADMVSSELELLRRQRDDTSENDDLEMSDKISKIKALDDRIIDLTETLKGLSEDYSLAAKGVAMQESNDFKELFIDIAATAYSRFKNLDAAGKRDRDVVMPMDKMARLLGYAYDKVTEIEAGSKGDLHAAYELIKMAQGRSDTIEQERIESMTALKDSGSPHLMGGEPIDVDDIAGVGEIGKAENLEE